MAKGLDILNAVGRVMSEPSAEAAGGSRLYKPKAAPASKPGEPKVEEGSGEGFVCEHCGQAYDPDAGNEGKKVASAVAESFKK